jgi:hypothetical protein
LVKPRIGSGAGGPPEAELARLQTLLKQRRAQIQKALARGAISPALARELRCALEDARIYSDAIRRARKVDRPKRVLRRFV